MNLAICIQLDLVNPVFKNPVFVINPHKNWNKCQSSFVQIDSISKRSWLMNLHTKICDKSVWNVSLSNTRTYCTSYHILRCQPNVLVFRQTPCDVCPVMYVLWCMPYDVCPVMYILWCMSCRHTLYKCQNLIFLPPIFPIFCIFVLFLMPWNLIMAKSLHNIDHKLLWFCKILWR